MDKRQRTTIIQGALPGELQYVTDTVAGYIYGPAIRFFPVTQPFARDHLVREDTIFQIPCLNYGFFRTVPNKGIFCYADVQPPVSVRIHHYPSFREMSRLDDLTTGRLLDIALTYTKLLITLLGRTENQVKIWHWEPRTVLCSLELPDIFVPNIRLSLSTWNWRDFAIVGDGSLRLFTIDHAPIDEPVRSVICERSWHLPYSRNSVPRHPDSLFQCINTSNPEDRFSLEAVAHVPPNMTEVFTDELLGRVCLIPTAHTWHLDGGLYIGTSEGSVYYFHPHHTTVPPAILGLDTPTLPVRQIVASKDGIAVLNSAKDLWFALMNSPTEIQSVVMPLHEERVKRLWQTPRNDRWLTLTESVKFHCFVPGNAGGALLYSRKDFARFISVGKFFGGCLYSLQEFGILKIWNSKDEPEFTYQLCCNATAVDHGPVIDLLAVGSQTGYIHILDCTYSHNGRQPRLVHSVRIFSSAVKKIRFDVSGTILMATAENPPYKLVILSALPSKSWRILGVVRLPDTVMEFHGVLDGRKNVFVAVGIATNQDPAIGTDLITFRLSPALCNNRSPFYSNILNEFTDNCIVMKHLKLKISFRTFAVESHNSIFFATTTKHLIHARSETWSRTPTVVTGTASLKYPVTHLVFLPEIEHVLVVDTRGASSVRFVGFFTEISKDEVNLGEVTALTWKQDEDGFHTFFVTKSGQLVCRTVPFIPELEMDVKDTSDANDNMPDMLTTSEETEMMGDCQTLLPDLVGSYNPSNNLVVQEDTEEEAWLSMKSRLCRDQTAAENTVKAIMLQARYSLVKKQLTDLYLFNKPLNGLRRLREDYFELVDEGWVKLKKQREQEVCESKMDANLELIEHRLVKDKLSTRYSVRLLVQSQSMYGLRKPLKLSNFAVPKRSTAVVETARRVAFERELQNDFEKIAGRKVNGPNVRNAPDQAAGDVSSQTREYTSQIMRFLCGEDGTKAKIFDDLYYDDTITSRIQRVHQTAMLRECGFTLKEEYNRHFDQLMHRRSTIAEMLRKKMMIIQRRMQSTENDLTLPVMDLTVRNDEDPQAVIHQISDDQLTEYFKKSNTPLPLRLDSDDRSLAHATSSAYRNRHAGANRTQVHPPLDDQLKSTGELIEDCETLILNFDTDLLQLIRLKDKVVFAAGVIDLRALHLRQRVLFTEELTAWSKNLSFRSQKLTANLQRNKVNVGRARRVFNHIRQEYDKFVHNDATLDHIVKRELHDVSDLDGRALVQLYRKRPHPLRGLKQTISYKSQTLRPRTSELREEMTDGFFDTLEAIGDSVNRPEEIDQKTWVKFCELRRKKMESEMTFWMKHVELELYHGILKDYVVEEKSMQQKWEDLTRQTVQADASRKNLERNSDFVLTLTHGQAETECKPFVDYNVRAILIPLSLIETKNSDLQTECQKKMDTLNEVVKFREAVILLEWEKKVHRQKITDYEYERQFLGSQSAPLEFRNMVGKDFGEHREEKYQQLKHSLKQQRKTFKNDTQVWGDKVRLLQQKLIAFQHERHNREATMRGLMIELQERHAVGESIGIHADASESEMRQALVLKRLRLQITVKDQKKRIRKLRQLLWKWQRKTFPAIYRDIRNF